jgi:predicted enzyme related to lactoylglutathione lyase
MLNVIHFEICVDDLESAAIFYSNVFDWQIEPIEDGSEYWSIRPAEDPGKGIPGGLSPRYDEQNSTINTIEVPSLDRYADKVTENGGRVLAPKISIPGEGYVQYCSDPEGNTFGIMEKDKSAE